MTSSVRESKSSNVIETDETKYTSKPITATALTFHPSSIRPNGCCLHNATPLVRIGEKGFPVPFGGKNFPLFKKGFAVLAGRLLEMDFANALFCYLGYHLGLRGR